MRSRQVVLARALSLLWAAFWLLFIAVESVVWNTPVRLALPWVALGLLFGFLAFVPWKWALLGSIMLAVAGLSAGVIYAVWAPPQLPILSRVLTTAVFSVPPIAAGILFLIDGCRKPAIR